MRGLPLAAFPALELCSSWRRPPTCFISQRKRSPARVVCRLSGERLSLPGCELPAARDQRLHICPPGTAGAHGWRRVRGGGSGGWDARMRTDFSGAGEAGGLACPRGCLSLVRPGDGPVSSRFSDQQGVPGAQEAAQPRGPWAPLRTRGAAGRRAAGSPPTPGCLRTGTPRRPAARSAPAW